MQIKARSNSFCDKQTFQRREEAIDMLIALQKKHKKQKFRIYQCHLCGFFHLTTASKKKKHFRKSNRKVKKYPEKIPVVIPKKDHFRLPVAKKVSVHYVGAYNTGKMLTKEMADALKRKIENGA